MKKVSFISLLLIGFYILTHLVGLTSLPVFADEAIYIRWTQLIMDEPARYALFPLNDGKTPIFIWAMLPFQYLFSDPLFAGRFVSVLVGLGQMFTMGWLIKLLGGSKKTQWIGMLFSSILPYWYFHHRMALMDGMLTLWLSLAFGGVLQIASLKRKKQLVTKQDLYWILFTGVSFGLAMLTKLPAILFVPVLGLSTLFAEKFDFQSWLKNAIRVGIALIIGLILFVLLKLHPAFGQLFSRGSDFLFPLEEVLAGAWKDTLISWPNYLMYFVTYLTLPVITLCVGALFSPLNKKKHHLLFWLGLLYLLPIMLMGKVVYPRYLVSASIFFTLSAVLSFESFFTYLEKVSSPIKKYVGQIFLVILMANTLATSGVYIFNSIYSPESTPFVSADKEQYLYKWSSGHGIMETVAIIQDRAETETVAVATEGYFGTLPDALLMYLHGQDVTNLYVEGIGQPVVSIPDVFSNRAKQFDSVLLVVNSHRMQLGEDDGFVLLEEFCRPDDAPCLQVWEMVNE